MRINIEGRTYILVQIVSESEESTKLMGSKDIVSYAYMYDLKEKLILKMPADKIIGGKVE